MAYHLSDGYEALVLHGRPLRANLRSPDHLDAVADTAHALSLEVELPALGLVWCNTTLAVGELPWPEPESLALIGAVTFVGVESAPQTVPPSALAPVPIAEMVWERIASEHELAFGEAGVYLAASGWSQASLAVDGEPLVAVRSDIAGYARIDTLPGLTSTATSVTVACTHL